MSTPTPTLSCVNLKGGVGKTALAVNFAVYCGSIGKKTLLIDMDPQTNATLSCLSFDDWKKHATRRGTVADLLGVRKHSSAEGVEKSADAVIKKDVFKKVDLIPSHVDLFTVDLDMANQPARETKLRRAIKAVADKYDIIVCDCPPNLTIPTQNALAASTHYAVPVSPDFLSGLGIGLLLQRVAKFGQDVEIDLELAGIVISRVGRTADHRMETITSIRQQLGDKVLNKQINERVAVAKATAQQMSVYDSGDAKAASEFRTVSVDLLGRMGVV